MILQRTFLKEASTKKNIPIHAIGLSLYESLPGTTAEQIGNEVVRTQWLSVPLTLTLDGFTDAIISVAPTLAKLYLGDGR
jgi:uncharacterized protein